MAAEFNSQQSQVMLNVSENHCSSPAPKEREREVIEGSPAIERQNQEEALEPHAGERVEDSYHDTIPKQAMPDGAHYDDDNDKDDGGDDLYAVSPREKTQLRQAVSLPRVSQTKQKPAAPRSRNPIDALLDEGAVLANELQHAQPSKLGTVSKEGSNDLTNGYPPVDVAVTTIDARAKAPAMRSSERDAGDAEVRTTERTERNEQRNPKCTESTASKQPVHSSPDAAVTNAAAALDAQNDAAGGAGKTARQHSHSQNAVSVNQKRHEKVMTASAKGNTDPSPTAKGADKASQKQKSFASTTKSSGPSKVLKRSSQRKAKQSALANLKARRDSTSDESEDDSQGDASVMAVKSTTDSSTYTRKLPSPVTNFPPLKQSGMQSSQGKLKSVKSTLPATSKQALKASGNVHANALSTAESRVKASRDASANRGGSTQTISKSSKSQNSSTNLPATQAPNSSQEQQDSRNQGISSKRTGALKRPARERSRERSSQRESLYEISDNSPRKKKIQKVSKAPAGPQKSGHARRKMQSESVKKRTARSRERSKQNLVPMPPSSTVPKATASQNSGTNNSRGQDNNGPLRHSPKNDNLTRDGEADDRLDVLDGHVHREAQARMPLDELPADLVDDVRSVAPSDIEEGPAPVPSHTNEASRQTVRGRLQTPVMLPSSPPRSLNGTNNTRISDKPTIIAFSKHGPRNQGRLSIVEVPDSTAPIRHTSVRGTPATTFAAASGPSCTPLDVRQQLDYTQQSNATKGISQANVSTGDEDVFSAFTKNGKKLTFADMPETSKTEHKVSKRKLSKLDQVQEHDQFAEVDDYEGTTLVYDERFQMAEAAPRTASQIAMPPPQRGDGAPTRIRKILDEPVIAPASNVPTTMETRDPLENSQAIRSNKMQLVRQKPTSQSFNTAVTARCNGNDQTYENGVDDTTRKPFKPDVVPQVTNNATEYQAPLLPNETSARPRDLVKRPSRRPDRPSHRTKHDSQGVDILGSPYPKGLEVPRQATALEVFSMQAGLSSDRDFASDAIADRQLDFAAIPRMRSSTGVGRVSSNGKAVPIAPQEDSKVVSAIASGALAQELLVADSTQSPIGNPFVNISTAKASHGLEEFGKGLEEALLQHQTVADQKMAEVTSESQDGNDPDETLVETFSKRDASPQHVVEPPASKHTSRTSSEDAAAKVLEDVGDWRNTLKPHQTHLFDSLVVASHKLVRHIVDKETAHRDIVADYRRCGDIIVHELQSAHRREYEQYQKSMQGWKRQAADKLARYGDQLKQEAKKAERAKAEREKLKRSWIPVENAFEELLAGLD